MTKYRATMQIIIEYEAESDVRARTIGRNARFVAKTALFHAPVTVVTVREGDRLTSLVAFDGIRTLEP